MEFDHPLEPSIVRLLDRDEVIQGAGFLISDDLVCTCAHVVCSVLDLAADELPPQNAQIILDFPFLQADRATATIEHWTPEPDGDIAVLRLISRRPAGARKARLLNTTALAGRQVEFVGYPAGNDDGGWGDGRLGHRRANGTVQIEGERPTGYALQRGFSGTPVWDVSALVVVGMIVAAERDDRTKVGIMVPTSFIAEKCPDVAVNTARPVQALADGLGGLPNSPLDGFEHFLREYLGTRDRPAPFGGRDAAFEALDGWLADPATSFGLLVAEAGRGKSALLVRWAADLAQRDGADVVLVPVSIRFGTAARTVTWSMLGARLRHLHHEAGDPPADPAAWLGEVGIWLRQDRTGEHPLLIILDGADEAIDWSIGRDLRFPAEVGAGVKVLVSARAVAGRGAMEWARLLDWDDAFIVALPLLSPEGVGQALRSMGGRLAVLAGRADVIAEISRLSEGDPLMVRLWGQSLREAYAADDSAFSLADLADIQPGFHSFFERWLEEQQEQWRWQAHGDSERQEQVMQFFYLCATALGPVSRQEVAELGADKWTSPQIGTITKDAERFVIGDGNRQGWVFSHPKLGQYFCDERMVEEDRREWEQRFLALGQRTRQDLQEGQQLRRGSTYGLKHYGAHLNRFHELMQNSAGHFRESTCDCAENLHRLITPVWQRAWEGVDGTYEGFIADVNRSWEHAEAAGRRALRADNSAERRGWALTRQITYALIKASIESQTGHLPPRMISALVSHRIWTMPQALAHVRGLVEEERGNALVTLAPDAPHFRSEIISMAQAIADPSVRVMTLLQLATDSSGADRRLLTAQAQADLTRVLATDEAHWIMRSMPEIVPGLSPAEALALGNAAEDPLKRIPLLMIIASRLEDPARCEVLDEVLAAVRALGDPVAKLRVLASITKWPASPGQSGLLDEVLASARALGDSLAGLQALDSIIQLMPDPAQSQLRQEALRMVASFPPDRLGSVPLSILAIAPAGLCQAVSQAVLQETAAIRNPEARARVLRELAASLPTDARGPAQAAFMTAAKEIEDATSRASAITIGIVPMPAPMAYAVAEVLRTIGQDSEDSVTNSSDLATRARSLAELAATLPEAGRDELLTEALAEARSIENQYWRAIGLADVVVGLPDTLAAAAADAAATLEGKAARLWVLSRITQYRAQVGAPSLAAEVRHELPAREAINALEALIPDLPAAALSESLEAVLAIDDDLAFPDTVLSQGISRLLDLAADQPEARRLEMLSLAARATVKVRPDYYFRSSMLAEVSPQLPESVLRTLLRATREIHDSLPQAWSLTSLLPYFPADQAATAARILDLVHPDFHSYKSRGTLQDLIPWISPEQILTLAKDITVGSNRDLLPALSDRLAELGALDDALELARTFEIAPQVSALASLADVVPGDMRTALWAEMLAAARQLDPFRRSFFLQELATSQPQPEQARLISEAVTAAREIEGLADRITRLAHLLPQLSPQQRRPLIDELPTAIEQVPSARDRAAMLTSIGSGLSGSEQLAFLSASLHQVRQLRSGMQRAWALDSIAPALPEPLLSEALELAGQIPDEHARSTAVAALAPRLSEPLVRAAIVSTEAFYEDYWRAEALQPLLVRLAELGHGQEVLARATSVTADYARAQLLDKIAAYLPADSLGQAFDLALAIDRLTRSYALVGLLCRRCELGDDAGVLQEAATIDDTERRATVLAYIARRPREAISSELYESWCRALRQLASRPRPDLLSDLAALAPLLARLGGPAAIADIAESITELGEWFP